MSLITTLVGSKLAVAVIALGTLTVGGTAAAAYTGSLPAGLQDEAHALLGAPTAQPTSTATPEPTDDPSDAATPEPTGNPTDMATPEPTETSTPDDVASPSATEPTGPDATGPAAFGLCTAFEHGGLDRDSVAYESLVKAAGSADGIAAYCGTVVAPGHDSGEHKAEEPASSTPEPTEAPETPPQPKGSDDHADHNAPQAPEGSDHSGGGHDRP